MDTDAGLGYCQGDAYLYENVLRDCLRTSGERQAELQSCYEAGNWKDYGTAVHALKSTAMMIGARELAGVAANLETASDSADAEAIRQAHPAMIIRHQILADVLAAHIDVGAPDADDEVMEFMPD